MASDRNKARASNTPAKVRARPLAALVHKGYPARIGFDPDDMIFVGRLAGIEDIVSFHGESVDELILNFRIAVDGYLEMSVKLGRPAQKPHSGRILLRVPPEVHARAAMMVQARGKSLNQWAAEALAAAAG